MATRQYVGARYVPIIDGEWDNSKAYDPLVIVSYQGNSYTSRTFVPAGIDINNTTYWALTGNYNAQVEAYRQEVAAMKIDVDKLVEEAATNLKPIRTSRLFRVVGNTVSAWNAIAYTNNGFTLFAEDVSDHHIIMVKCNTSGSVIRTVDLDITGHPNAACFANNVIYMLDTTNQKIYTINNTTDSIINIYDVDDGASYRGICSYENKVYLWTGPDICLFEDGTITEVINIDISRPYPEISSLDFQTFIIFNDYIIILHDRPNQLSFYKFSDGTFLGYNVLGDGNGMFPYGELESACVVNNQLVLFTSAYARTISRYTRFIGQIFVTNLGDFDIADQYISENQVPAETVIYVDADAIGVNPTGEITNKFNCIDEACMVYSYNSTINNYYYLINIATGTYEDQSIKFNGCHFSVEGNGSTVGVIDLYDTTGDIKNITSASDTASYGIIYSSDISLKSVAGLRTIVRDSIIKSDRSNTIDLDLQNSSVIGIARGVSDADESSILNSEIVKLSDAIFNLNSDKEITLQSDAKAVLATKNTTRLSLSIVTAYEQVNFDIYYSQADITSVMNNNTVTKHATYKIKDSHGTPYTEEIDIKLTKTTITIDMTSSINDTTQQSESNSCYFNAYQLSII